MWAQLTSLYIYIYPHDHQYLCLCGAFQVFKTKKKSFHRIYQDFNLLARLDGKKMPRRVYSPPFTRFWPLLKLNGLCRVKFGIFLAIPCHVTVPWAASRCYVTVHGHGTRWWIRYPLGQGFPSRATALLSLRATDGRAPILLQSIHPLLSCSRLMKVLEITA